MSGLEIARFVEHIVCGQQHFALFEEDFSVGNESGTIGHWFTSIVLCPADVTDERWQRNFLRQAKEFLLIEFIECGALRQVLRRITAEAELGEDGQFGSARLGFMRQL